MKRKILSSLASALSLLFIAVPASAQNTSLTTSSPGSTTNISANAQNGSSSSVICTQYDDGTVRLTSAQTTNNSSMAIAGNAVASTSTAGQGSATSNANAPSPESCQPAQQAAAVTPAAAGTQVATLPNTGPVSPAEAVARVTAVLSGLAIAAYAGRALILRNQA